jgi:hypothetical protein
MLADSGGNASADDGVNAQVIGLPWDPAANKPIWFEARVKFSDVATTPDQFLIGLAAADTTLIAAGIADDVVDKCAFIIDTTVSAGEIDLITSLTSAEAYTNVKTGAANDTYYKLGFILIPASVTPYVDGVAGTAFTTVANIPTAPMTLSLVSQCEQTSADAEMSVDWVRIAQLS